MTMCRMRLFGVLLSATILSLSSCQSVDELATLFNASSLGGDIPGGRGRVRIGFINNTDYWAVFTYGVYDPLDRTHAFLDFRQYTLEPQKSLVGHTNSEVTTLTCARLLSVGTPEFLTAIVSAGASASADPLAMGYDKNGNRIANGGVFFYEYKVGDPTPDAPKGYATGIAVQQGTSGFACGRQPSLQDDPPDSSLVLFTFERDTTAPSGFRITYQILSAE